MTQNRKAAAEAAMKRVSHQWFNWQFIIILFYQLIFQFLGKWSKAKENKRKREEGERNESKDWSWEEETGSF